MKKQRALLIVLLIYAAISFSTYHYEKLIADNILFLSIADKYVSGNFADAVNGFWPPLVSWLLTPFLFFGLSHIVAINALNSIIGLLTIIGINNLSYRFEMSGKIRNVILFSLIPLIMYFSLLTPHDLLLLCILVFYLDVVFKNEYPDRIYNGIISGVLGAFAYFAKAYALPFFISHFLLINIYYYLRSATKSARRNVLRNAFAGMALFAVISGIWIITISNKYDYFTISTNGPHNWAVIGPEAKGKGKEIGQPMFTEGFLEPPNKTAIVMWEDPLDPGYPKVKSWSPFDSWRYFKYFIGRVILKNISQAVQILGAFSQLSITIIIIYILLCIRPLKELLTRGSMLLPLFTIALYTSGYGLMHYEPRYLWLVNILVLLMGGHLLYWLFRNEFFNNTRKNILIVFFVLSFIIVPVRYIIHRGDTGKRMHTLAAKLKSRYNIEGNIASNKEYVPTNEAWYNSYRLTYFLKTRYYGQVKEGISDSELESELKKYGIDYYFVWGKHPNIPRFLSNYKEVTGGEIPGLKIYSLKDGGADGK